MPGLPHAPSRLTASGSAGYSASSMKSSARTGDVFWFDSQGRVVLQALMTVVGEPPSGPEYDAVPWQSRLGLNRVLSDDEVERLRKACLHER